METINILDQVTGVDTSTPSAGQNCPGATCSNCWHRFQAFMDECCHTCGAIGGPHHTRAHAYWDSWERNGRKVTKHPQFSMRACWAEWNPGEVVPWDTTSLSHDRAKCLQYLVGFVPPAPQRKRRQA
jgi:hypothetical protein